MTDLEASAAAASSTVSPAELHGLVCGLASVAEGDFPFGEFVQLVGTEGLIDETSAAGFVGEALEAFYATDFSFAPLVPDDDEVLAVRLVGLAEWCAGFLSGFAAAAPETNPKSLPPDVAEILNDFISISGLDEDVEGDEQDEASFMELYEYVKVAAVLVLTLMDPERRE
ncbi:MAG: UPF0149 family protein [Pseudomonadota bacterium]